MKKITFALFSIPVFLVACAGGVTNEGLGTVSGGVIGGLVGSQFGSGSGQVAAAAGGALLGAYLGGNIGRTMDKVDRMQMQQALETAPVGRAVTWKNPDNGNVYSVKPTKTYYASNQPCREYTTHALIGGKSQEIYGKACRKADGSWKIAS